MAGPHVGVLSSHFPNCVSPASGLSVRDRMFRVARRLPLFVVSPSPWIPMEDWIRRNLAPRFRPSVPEYEEQQGIPVWFPRYVTLPGLEILRSLDGWAMAQGAYARFAAMRRAGRLDLIDAHGAYPDGYAGVLLGRRLGVPTTVTLYGSELVCARDPRRVQKLRETFQGASRIFAVCDIMRQFVLKLGIPNERVEIVGSGVDAEHFRPCDRTMERAALGVPSAVPIMVSVGLSDCSRVIEVLPSLIAQWSGLVYLVIDPEGSGEGGRDLENLVERMGLNESVRLLHGVPPEKLPALLSAADLFVCAASQEGRVSTLLEAMACGLPVVAADAGINREIVCRPDLGELIPSGEQRALENALVHALSETWDRNVIRRYAESHHWDARIDRLCRAFSEALKQ